MARGTGNDFLIPQYSETPPFTPEEVVAYSAKNGSMTHNVTTLTDQMEDHARDDPDIPKLMWMFLAPLIFLVGLCGNLLVIMVMSRKRMQGTTTSVYLRSMAVADIGVIITGIIPEWLDFMEIIVFKDIHPATCKLEKFVFYSFGDVSIWILVIFTVDRFIAVCYPLRTKNICVASRAPWFVLGAVLLAAAKNLCVFWTRGGIYEVQQQWRVIDGTNTSLVNVSVRVDNCGRPYRHFELFIRPWIAFTLVSLIPFLVILFCNTFIIRALIKVRRMRSQQATFSSRDKTLLQMTFMCLAASFCFLICITPSIILLIGKPYWKLSRDNYAYDIAKTVNNLLMFVNHSINFFLYCMTGKRFRTELVNMIKRRSRSPGSRGGEGDSSLTEGRTSYYRVSALRPISRRVTAKNGLVKYSKVENRLHNRESSL